MVKVTESVRASTELLIKRIAAETGRLVSQGANIVNLSQGVPCLDIFPSAQRDMCALINGRKLPYSDVPGVLETRQTAAAFVNTTYSQMAAAAGVKSEPLNCTASNVILSAGAIQCIYNCLALSVEGKDDVVLTTLPAYGLYKHQTELLGGRIEFVPTSASHGYVPSTEALQRAFDNHTFTDSRGQQQCRIRSIVLCYPNNPTGAVLTAQDATRLAGFLDQQLQRFPSPGFSVVLDEVYVGTVVKGQTHVSLLNVASPRLRQSLFLVLSASKGLGAMPGARIAWITAPNEALVPELAKIQLACSGNASTISQVGLQASLKQIMDEPDLLDRVSAYYAERTRYVCDRLQAIGKKYNLGPICQTPQATFYIWADFSRLPTIRTDVELVNVLRDMHKVTVAPAGPEAFKGGVGVATVPGSAFLVPAELKLLRLSCAKPAMEDLRAAMDVIEEVCRRACAPRSAL